MYAITPKSIGRSVGARKIKPDWSLLPEETFVVEEYDKDMVLAEDMVSLRYLTESEVAVIQLEKEREKMSVTPYQARQALLDQNYLDTVQLMMEDINTPEEIKLMWAYKQQIRRLHPATNQMLDKLNMTEEQKDDLFRYAMSLES